MTSVYQRALGADFGRLHPEMQRLFGVASSGEQSLTCTGIMHTVVRGNPLTLPLLYLGSLRAITIPDQGSEVPFTLNIASWEVPEFGEAVRWKRVFNFPGADRRFDTTTVHSQRRGCAVDYLGSRHDVAADIAMWIDQQRALVMETRAQRVKLGPLRFNVPGCFSANARATTWFDDSDGRFHISVHVTNRIAGLLFSYDGTFEIATASTP